MSPQELAAIEARAAAATPGPWAWDEWHRWGDTTCGELTDADGDHWIVREGAPSEGPMVGPAPTLEFIAHARADVDALVREVRRLRALLAETEGL